MIPNSTPPSPAAALKGSYAGTEDMQYRYWRRRVMYAMVGGYAAFYLVRKNLSLASKSIMDEFHFSNTQWGMVLSAATIVYALSKFGSGIIADRASSKYMMSIGLLLSALCNIVFGYGSSLTFFLVIWALNNAFQGMGMPPCSRLLTVWYPPEARGRAWGMWNASHQIGGAIIVVWAAYLVDHFGWRHAFWQPAFIAAVFAIWIFNRIVDRPEDVKLGDASLHASEEASPSYGEIFKRHILKNRWVWLLSIANFFVYVVRIGILDWAPKYLQDSKGFDVKQAGLAISGFELAGVFGAYLAGWLSDKVFRGHHGKVSALFMTFVIFAVLTLLIIPSEQVLGMSILLSVLGFFHAGPMLLIGVGAADYASREAAATAVGLTGLFGYLGASVCAVLTGYLADHWGWNAAIWFYGLAACFALLLLIFIPKSPQSS